MAGFIEGLSGWDRGARAALAVLIVVIAATAGSLVYAAVESGSPVPERTVGDLTVTGSIAREGVEPNEYGGTATLTYTGGGTDVEWRILDTEDTKFVQDYGGNYRERGYTTASNTRTLTIDDPGRYSVRMYVDGDLTRSGTAVLDGTVQRDFAWTQTLASGDSYTYGVTFQYRFSDYMAYADLPVDRFASDIPAARFVVTDEPMRALESALRAEYAAVRGLGAQTGGQEYADYLLSFVQCCIKYPDQISKVGDRYVLDTENGSGDLFLDGTVERWAFPLETVHKGYGDCEDTSFLAASLFSAAGYTTAVTILPDHMVAGVVLDRFTPIGSVPGIVLADKALSGSWSNIFFCETTLDFALPCGYVTSDVALDLEGVDRVLLIQP